MVEDVRECSRGEALQRFAEESRDLGLGLRRVGVDAAAEGQEAQSQ
jgi:hypothetical protein